MTGLVGVAASLLMFAADCVVLDSPASGAEIFNGMLDRITASPIGDLKRQASWVPLEDCCS